MLKLLTCTICGADCTLPRYCPDCAQGGTTWSSDDLAPLPPRTSHQARRREDPWPGEFDEPAYHEEEPLP